MTRNTSAAAQTRQTVKIPRDHHKFILGRKGKRLQEIEAGSGTKISMPRAGTKDEEITVVGSKDGIDKAIREMRAISTEQSTQAFEKFDIPKIYHPFVCGPNNETINQLMKEHGVRINMPPYNMQSSIISVTGDREPVLKCKEKMINIFTKMEKTCKTTTVKIPKDQHRFVIGIRGANIADILSKTKVSVELPSSESKSETVTLRGPSAKLNEAKALLTANAGSTVKKTIKIPTWTHKYLIGKKGATIKEITQDHDKVQVEFSQNSISLEGPSDEVEIVSQKLLSASKDTERQFLTEEMTVDARYLKFIIGKGGSNVNRISQETGAVIQMLEEKGGKNKIVIEGSKDGVKKAKKELNDMMSKMKTEKEREITIDQHLHRELIGQRGESIREIRDKFNQVLISFPETGEKSDIVKIRGSKEDVDNCYQHLNKIVQDIKKGSFVLKINIDRQLHRLIVGRGGSTINAIRDETNTRIELPSTGVVSDEIVIYGKKGDCEKAKQRMMKIKDEFTGMDKGQIGSFSRSSNNVTKFVDTPTWTHKFLIGKGGSNIREIMQDNTTVTVDFKEDKIRLEGPPKDVDQIEKKLLAASKDLEKKFLTDELVIDSSLTKFIIGRGGANINRISQETGVTIQFIEDKGKTRVAIEGSKEGARKAKQEINDMISKVGHEAEREITIDQRFHRLLIGQGGESIREIREMFNNQVMISFPSPGDTSDDVKIRGNKADVDKCYTHLSLLVQEMKESNYILKVNIPRHIHRLIVGKGGSTVNTIKEETNTRIDLPTEGSNSDEISIYGKKEDCRVAKERLLKIEDQYTGAERARTTSSSSGRSRTISSSSGVGLGRNFVTKYVDTPSWAHKFLIGRKGANIKEIMQDNDKVNVEFTDINIRLEGPPEEVNKIAEKLKIASKEITDKFFVEEISIDSSQAKFIIGRGGSNINRISQETGAQLEIQEEKGKTKIVIDGNREAVLKAKREIQEMTSRMGNEKEREITIDQRFHRALIGQGGENIREIRDMFNQVLISFPEPGERSDIVRIRGNKPDVDKCYSHLSLTAQEMQGTNYSLKVNVNRHLHKFIIGKGGSTINAIRDETNTRIDMPSEGSNSDEILIFGSEADCKRAKDKIMNIQGDYDSVLEVDIIIPSRYHNALIGAGGKVIQSISQECGNVRIKFPPPESRSDKVFIRGMKEDVFKAKKMLLEMSDEKQTSEYVEEIKANPRFHRFLIGRNGDNIRKIVYETGAQVSFPNDRDERQDVITISGKKQSVLHAKDDLLTMIRNLENENMNDQVGGGIGGGVEIFTSVDPKYHRHFVIRRGEVINQISDEFGGVIISFPRQGVDSSKVSLRGSSKDSLKKAADRIQAIVSELEDRVTLEVEIAQKHHRMLLGARGSRVMGLSDEFDVSIKFPDRDVDSSQMINDSTSGIPPQDKVIIQGRKDNCEEARDALLSFIQDTVEIRIPSHLHKFIIGVRGETVRSISSEFDVQIKVPPANEQSDIIVISGSVTNVARAKEALLDKVPEHEGVDGGIGGRQNRNFKIQLKIDPEYYPRIIGKGGVVISKIRDKCGVEIDLPQKGSQDRDYIIITGGERNCQEAKSAILELTGDLNNTVTEKVEIDQSIHSRLIGTRGRNIRKIMSDFRVEVNFPKGDDNLVTIIGVKQNVEDCREHLLSLEEEYMQDMDDSGGTRRTKLSSYNFASDSQTRDDGDALTNWNKDSDWNKGPGLTDW